MPAVPGSWLFLLPVLLLAGCHFARAAAPGVRDAKLAPCPSSPNCVSSQADDELHRVAPLTYVGTGADAMARLAATLRALPRATLVTAGESYLHAEFRSAVFGFVDDVEFLLDDAAKVIHVRSASRVGRSDLGVNRRRVESLRKNWSGRAP